MGNHQAFSLTFFGFQNFQMSIYCILLVKSCRFTKMVPSTPTLAKRPQFVGLLPRVFLDLILWKCFRMILAATSKKAPFLAPFSSTQWWNHVKSTDPRKGLPHSLRSRHRSPDSTNEWSYRSQWCDRSCRRRLLQLTAWKPDLGSLGPSSSSTQMEKLQFLHWIWIPSDKLSQNYGKWPFLMGKSTISMAIFNSKLLVYQRVATYTIWLLNIAMENPPIFNR